MTEDDARKKWCPFCRVLPAHHEDDGPPVNREARHPTAIPDGCTCLASACMAWRWYLQQDGYCGLAGPVDRQ